MTFSKTLSALLVLLASFLLVGPTLAQHKKKKKSSAKPASAAPASTPDYSAAYVKPKAAPGAPLAEFNLLTAEQKLVLSRDLPADKPITLVLFNPGCGHCADVASSIKKNAERFAGIQFVFITAMNQLELLKGFSDGTGLSTLSNALVGGDNSDLTSEIFEYKGIPQIMIYNKDHFLQKTFYKDLNLDSLAYYSQQ